MRKRTAALATTALLTLPLVSAISSPVSATDTGTVTQVSNGNNKSTVPIINGVGDVIAFHTLATNLGGTPTFVGIENIFTSTSAGLAEQAIDGVFPDMSANGRYVVYSKPQTAGCDAVPDGLPDCTQDVRRLDRQTNTDIAVTANRNGISGSSDNFPGVAVDNNGNVVFQSLASDLIVDDVADGGWDIFYFNGTATTKLSDETRDHFLNPDVSANGTMIVYDGIIGPVSGGARDLYRATPAGGQTSAAAGNGNDQHGQVSDDGTKVVFQSDSTTLVAGSSNTINAYIWASSGITRVTSHGDAVAITNPAISGDGAFIAYERGNQIYRSVAATNGTTIQLSAYTGPAGIINWPSVNGNGSKVVFAQNVGGGATTPDAVANVEVMLWSAATAPPAPVFCNLSDRVLNAEYQAKRGSDALIARLYAAFFTRNPDTGGFGFWRTEIAANRWTNARAAAFFGESAEFKARYGASLTNEQFVDLLYGNVMCRLPEPGGRAFWLAKLSTDGWTRGQVALSFSDSAEFRGRVNHPLQG